jgi:hypothetical protein
MRAIDLHPQLVPLASIDDGINAVRRTLPLCVFHPRTETTGFAALEAYHRDWDDEKKTFKPTAVHDWSSHPADSFRYLAQSWRKLSFSIVDRVPEPEPGGWIIPPPRQTKRGLWL